MKRKIWVVIVLFLLGCALASAQSFTLKSAVNDQGCTVQLQNVSGNVWLVTETCDGSTTYSIGITGGLTAKQNPLGFAIKGVVFGSSYTDQFGNLWSSVSVVRMTCSDKKYGWVAFSEKNGMYTGDSYGYVSCDVPVRGAAAGERPPAASNAEAPRK